MGAPAKLEDLDCKKNCFCCRINSIIQLHISFYGTTFEERREKITTTMDDNLTTRKYCWHRMKNKQRFS